jgi:hypothetical protein
MNRGRRTCWQFGSRVGASLAPALTLANACGQWWFPFLLILVRVLLLVLLALVEIEA